MVTARRLLPLLVLGVTHLASAQTKPTVAPLIGATEVTKVTPPAGFIDDVVAADDQRVAYVVADAASRAELHVIVTATKAEQVIDLAPVTLHPVELVLVGARAFVVGVNEDGSQVAGLFDLVDRGKTKPAGKVLYRLGPATGITVITRDGKQRVAVHKATPSKTGTTHAVELDAIETGRRVAGRTIEVETGGKYKSLTINHWSDGFTRAYGIKEGEWDKKEDQRAADQEAMFDLVTGKTETHKIEDLFEQRRRFQALAESGNRQDFVRVAQDNSGLQVWKAGKPRAVELDQPLSNYDLKSLQAVVNADGTAWIALKVDPVNPDAVARKKADPEYLDIFRTTADGKATRKARILATGQRHRFGVAATMFWLLERNTGFERGGKSLSLYALQ